MPAFVRSTQLLSLAVLLASGGAASRAAETLPQPQDLVHGVVAMNAATAAYQAKIGVDFHLRSFPYISQHLDGESYFKPPDNFEVVFDNVPKYAKGFDKLYFDDDPSKWDKRFTMSVVGRKPVAGHDDVIVRMVQRVKGMIDHQDVAIDPARSRIDRIEWDYYNGGVITMDDDYTKVDGYELLSAQHATIHIPFVHAGADAVYTGYKTNVQIDDSVFTKEKHK